MSQSLFYRIRTDKDVQWTGAIVQNAGANETITVPWADAPLSLTLTGISVLSDQNLAWEFNFWNSALFGSSSNMDLDGWIGLWGFAAADGQQIAATGNYRYYIDGLEIPLWNSSANGTSTMQELYVSLVNRSATSKNAGATGEIVVTFHVQAQQVGGA